MYCTVCVHRTVHMSPTQDQAHAPANYSKLRKTSGTTHNMPCSYRKTNGTTHIMPCSYRKTSGTTHNMPCSNRKTSGTTHNMPCSNRKTNGTTHNMPCSNRMTSGTKHNTLCSYRKTGGTAHNTLCHCRRCPAGHRARAIVAPHSIDLRRMLCCMRRRVHCTPPRTRGVPHADCTSP